MPYDVMFANTVDDTYKCDNLSLLGGRLFTYI